MILNDVSIASMEWISKDGAEPLWRKQETMQAHKGNGSNGRRDRSNHPANGKKKIYPSQNNRKYLKHLIPCIWRSSFTGLTQFAARHYSACMHLYRCRQATGRAASWELSWTKLRRNQNSCEVASGDIVCRVQKRPPTG